MTDRYGDQERVREMRQLGAWPTDLRYEDADVTDGGLIRMPLPAATFMKTASSAKNCVDFADDIE